MFNFLFRRSSRYFISWEWIAPWNGKTYKDSDIFTLYPEKTNIKNIQEKISYSYMAPDGEDIPSSHITLTAMSKL